MGEDRLFLVVVNGQIVFPSILSMSFLHDCFFIRDRSLFTTGGGVAANRERGKFQHKPSERGGQNFYI